MISLTGGNLNRKLNLNGQRKVNGEVSVEPDNEYLETMKQRMGAHLPTNTSGNQGIIKNLRDQQSNDIIDKAMENMLNSEHSSKNGSKSVGGQDDKQMDSKILS